MPFVPPVVSVTIFANEECRHSSSFPRLCGTTKPKADGYSATRHRKSVGWATAHCTVRGISRGLSRAFAHAAPVRRSTAWAKSQGPKRTTLRCGRRFCPPYPAREHCRNARHYFVSSLRNISHKIDKNIFSI